MERFIRFVGIDRTLKGRFLQSMVHLQFFSTGSDGGRFDTRTRFHVCGHLSNEFRLDRWNIFSGRIMKQLDIPVLLLSSHIFALSFDVRQLLVMTASSHFPCLRSLKVNIDDWISPKTIPDLMLCLAQLLQEMPFQLLSLTFLLLVISLLSR